MNNTRFSTNIHILTLLAIYPQEWISSEFIADSININSVIVRKEIAVLLNAGLVESKKGKEGGCRLAKKAKDIKLSEIFLLVKNTEVLGKKNKHTNPACIVGKSINIHLTDLYEETDEKIFKFLSKKSLADFSNQFL